MRVAAVDLGTNTTRLLVADVDGDRIDEVVRRSTVTRLGEGVNERHRLLPEPVARVRNVLADYRREAEALGAQRVLAVATSAVRDAENGEAFLGEVEWSYGFATELLSGEEEAALTLRGVGALDDDTVVVDIGGGSTELISTAGATSVDVGSGRLTELFGEDVDAMADYVRERLPDLRAARAVGVGGTITSLAQGTLTADRLDELLATREFPPLEPGRAEVILAGTVIAREVLRALGLVELRVSERDILDGAAFAAAELPERAEGDAPPGAFTCC